VYYKSGYNGIKPADIKPFPSGLHDRGKRSPARAARGVLGCVNYIGHLAAS
jgi:hypothetical protein